MHEKKHTLSTSHMLKTLKQQRYNRNLIDYVIELLRINDHDTLAYIARTAGIPPQLRHAVWPVLLKYHPMCIAPNILSNIVTWEPTTSSYHMIMEPDMAKAQQRERELQSRQGKGKSAGEDTGASRKTSSEDGSSFNKSKSEGNEEATDEDQDEELERMIMHDLQKYFKLRTKMKNSPISVSSNTSSTVNINTPDDSTASSGNTNTTTATNDILTTENELKIITVLKDAILNFTKKWAKVYRYESGLAWIALGLAEWCPPIPVAKGNSDGCPDQTYDGPVLLCGKKHSHATSHPMTTMPSTPHPTSNTATSVDLNSTGDVGNATDNQSRHATTIPLSKQSTRETSSALPPQNFTQSTSLAYLYHEYPLPESLQDRLPDGNIFSFQDLYERILLVILHGPDCEIATKNINRDFPSKSTYLTNYFPVLTGGDLSFQFQLFFKVFSSILPELYQPLNDESSLQPNSIRSSWLYWWMKCAGARSLQRQDRGRIWDILLGWRPKPNMDTMNFFLNYNDKKIFSQLYHSPPLGLEENFLRAHSIDISFVKKLTKDNPFWFPDLDNINLGSKEFPYDYNVFKELLLRNKYEQVGGNDSNGLDPQSRSNTAESLANSLAKSLSPHLSEKGRQSSPGVTGASNECNNLDQFSYSQVHPHIQVIFVYIAVLQYNEFKLLEFEETEILEFLNNLPMFSKSEDSNFRNLYLTSEHNADSTHTHIITSRRKSTMNVRGEETTSRKMSSSVNPSYSAGLSTRSSSSSLSTISDASTTNTASSVVFNSTANQAPHMMIEVGNDAKSSNSFNDLLTIAGDIWRKWLWKELEESITNDI